LQIIRELDHNDRVSVEQIWRECFTTDTLYINNFVNSIFPFSKTFGLFDRGEKRALSIASLLPSYIILKGGEGCQRVKGGYLYGVGTLLAERGNRYSKAVIEEIFNYAFREQYRYIVAKPATEELYSLYEKLTFTTTLYSQRVIVEKRDIKESTQIGWEADSLTAERYFELREESSYGTHILWERELLEYALGEAKYRGGNYGVLKVEGKREIYYCYYREGNQIEVVDHNAVEECEIDRLLYNVLKECEKSKINNQSIEGIVLELPLSNTIAKYNSAQIVRNSLIKRVGESSGDMEIVDKMMISLPVE